MKETKNGIIGLAIGDAMGVPFEFCLREKLMQNPITEMVGYNSHNVPKGCWSDDTSMTLATIDSINNKSNIDTFDIANNFVQWMKHAKYTATDKVFDIGRSTLQALSKCEVNYCKPEEAGGKRELDNGNGSLMRILPVAYYCYAKKLKEEEILKYVKKVSSITHAHEISIMGCYIYVLFAIELLKGKSIKKAYKKIKKINYSMFSSDCIYKYNRILENDIGKYNIDDISSQGYVLSTLEATLWTVLNTKNYNQAIITAINLGNDTDTVGACTGGLAGIKYGIKNINEDWKKDLLKYDYIEELCNKFDEVLYK